jgi:flavin reductase (DIM6/NTAB) family NADH-FMN oxidoreductase RutF
MAISIGKTRWSHEAILGTGEFVLSFPSSKQARQASYCGTHSRRDVEKLAQTDLEITVAKCVKAPLLTEMVASFECRVTQTIETGDHTVFVGEVAAAHASDGSLGRGLYDFGLGLLRGLV